jgi:Spy/CpxP family protein refolding chaperone
VDKKVLVGILVISVAINLATMFTFGYFWWTRQHYRRDFPSRAHMMPGWYHSRIAKELGLNTQQIEQMKRATEEMRTVMQPVRQELFEKRQELMALVREQEPDRNRAEALIKEISVLQAQHDEQIFDRMLTVKKILTPDQQKRLGDLLHTLLEAERPPEFPPSDRPHHPFEVPEVEEGR